MANHQSIGATWYANGNWQEITVSQQHGEENSKVFLLWTFFIMLRPFCTWVCKIHLHITIPSMILQLMFAPCFWKKRVQV
jgi:hypothetical protein